MPGATVTRLAAAIEIHVRAHKTAAPAPRGLAYLGLEGASGTGFHLLDALAARGIFRKYEFVLDVGAGLGGTSRWLAGRLGCEVVGTAASRAEAEAGASLTRRAGLAAQVRLVPTAPPPACGARRAAPSSCASAKPSRRRSPTARCASCRSSRGGPEGLRLSPPAV